LPKSTGRNVSRETLAASRNMIFLFTVPRSIGIAALCAIA
jgi:hypothetical protein